MRVDADKFELNINVKPSSGCHFDRWKINVKTNFCDTLKAINEVGKELKKVSNSLSAKNLRPIVKKAITNSLNRGPQGKIDEYGWPDDWN